jgi:hypothetical protein
MATTQPVLAVERAEFHAALLATVLTSPNGVPSNADGGSKISVAIAKKILQRIGSSRRSKKLVGQSSGVRFEETVHAFLKATFPLLSDTRPGRWAVIRVGSKDGHINGVKITSLADFEQYRHLARLNALVESRPELAADLGSDYLIKPDTVIARLPEPNATLNRSRMFVSNAVAERSTLRENYNNLPILHASVSCKWTIRSDRAQNARSEALNLIRNRKGRAPHIVVVAGEPLPSRLASLASGTGDIDCVYHFALSELIEATQAVGSEYEKVQLSALVEGGRLKDISDLPLDLAV